MTSYYTLCIGPDYFANRLPALAVYVPALAYGYVGLAILTDDYLLPAVAQCVEALGVPSEVASSLMEAAASSVAEVAPIIESAIFTDDDVSTESFLASAMFKMLLIVGITAIASPMADVVNWRPLVGDGCFFTIMVAALILVSYALTPQWAHWFEGLLVLLLYAVYGVFVFVTATPLSIFLHRTWPPRGADIVGVAGEQHGNDAVERLEDATEEDADSDEPGPARDGARQGPQSVAALREPGADTSQPHLVDGAVPVSTNSRTDRHPSSSATSNPIEGNVRALSHRRAVGDTASSGAVAGDVTSQTGTAASSEERGRLCIVRLKVVAFTALRVVTAPWRLLFWVLFLDRWRMRQAGQWWLATMAAALIYMFGLSYAVLQAARWIDCVLEKESDFASVQAVLLALGASVPDAIAAVQVARSGGGGAVPRSILSSLLHEAGVGLGFAWMTSHAIRYRPQYLPAVPFLLYVEPWILLVAAWVGLLASLAVCRWHLHRSLGLVLLFSYGAYMLYNFRVVSPLAIR